MRTLRYRKIHQVNRGCVTLNMRSVVTDIVRASLDIALKK